MEVNVVDYNFQCRYEIILHSNLLDYYLCFKFLTMSISHLILTLDLCYIVGLLRIYYNEGINIILKCLFYIIRGKKLKNNSKPLDTSWTKNYMTYIWLTGKHKFQRQGSEKETSCPTKLDPNSGPWAHSQ